MQRLATLVAGAALASLANAQFTVVIPNGLAAAEGSTSNAFPWGRTGIGLRHQAVYDSSHFTLQGITFPIVIQGLKWRPNTNVALVASSYTAGCSVQLSTSPLDQGSVSTTMASNQGPDLTTCYSGVVSWAAQPAQAGPTPFGISIPFTTNFVYDPNLGDLNIECDLPIQTFTGAGPQLDVHGVAPLASRVFISTGYPGTGVGTITLNHGVVVEVTYVPASGLFPGFSGTPRTGPIGTIVQFTDSSFSSAPGGVATWAWDFDGDSIIDSNLQNPSFQYNAGGNYTVSLTVTDSLHPPQTHTKPNYIGIALAEASFTTVTVGTTVSFTDTSAGNPTSWAWDFENDGIVDSVLQNPVHVYPAPGAYNCKLTAANAYSSDDVIVNLGVGIIPVPGFGSTFTSATLTRGLWFQAPTRFSITSLQVPDESNHGLQNVAVYRMSGAAPAFPATLSGGLEFLSLGVASTANIPCVVSFDNGEFVGVLGACGDTTTMRSSYATPAGPFASSILGSPTTLTRFLTQTNLVSANGTGAYSSETAGALGRVFIGVSAAVGLQYGTGSPSPYAPAPSLKTTALPIIGQSAEMTVTTNDALAVGLLAVGFGRVNIPTPLGTLLINGVAFTDVVAGGAPLTPGSYTYNFAIPNNPSLQGAGPLNWQTALIVLPTGEFALSNATEWWLSQ